MSWRGRNEPKTPRRPGVILVCGEDAHDRDAIRHLIVALRPEYEGRTKPRKEPLLLAKNVAPEKLAAAAKRLAAIIVAEERVQLVDAVVAHEDCDEVEPAHEKLAKTKRAAFAKVRAKVIPAVPAWELETWLMLWPAAAPLVSEKWRAPVEWTKTHVGKVEHAKQKYAASLVSHHAARVRRSVRQYEEKDSVPIAKVVRDQGWASAPKATSDSYTAFMDAIDEI